MGDSDFVEECLKYHNALRSLHNAPELIIDIKLNDFAQDWALTLAEKDTIEHRPENDYGENLYVGSSSEPDWKLEPQVPVQSWYDEISAYKFAGEPSAEDISEIGHFTQLVWKSTEKLGVGKASSESGKIYVVCNYEPAGNVMGQFADNVTSASKSLQLLEDQDENPVASTTSVAQSSVTGSQQQQSTTKIIRAESRRLRALPAEELRVWSSWLSKVADTAVDEWDEWLLAHISLTLRLLEYLRKAEKMIEQESPGSKQQEESEVSFGDGGVRSKAATAQTSVMSEKEKNEVNYTDADTTVASAKSRADDEKSQAASRTVEEAEEGANKTESEVGKSSSRAEVVSLGASRSKSENSEAIPIPVDECEMLEIMRDFERQAKKYHSLYKHWLKMAEKVLEEVAEKSAELSKQSSVRTHEENPFCFFLEEEVEFDCDDEEGEIADNGLEKITYENLNLFFNLTDEQQQQQPVDTKASSSSESSLKKIEKSN